MSKKTDPQLRVRIPEELKAILEQLAKNNDRTLTAEITRRLKDSIESDGINPSLRQKIS